MQKYLERCAAKNQRKHEQNQDREAERKKKLEKKTAQVETEIWRNYLAWVEYSESRRKKKLNTNKI